MQFSSYFPGCYAPRNLSLDATGSAWPQNHGVKISESGNFCNAFLSPDYLLAYNKELLKQTMLKHETIFKDQVNLPLSIVFVDLYRILCFFFITVL